MPAIEIWPKILKKSKTQVFLAHLSALLALVVWSYFCLVEIFIISLIVGFAIDKTEFIDREITVGFFKYLRWKVLMSLQRYSTTKIDSQVFFLLK